jgi:inosine-uridine nucleoside N-ribohydrolase
MSISGPVSASEGSSRPIPVVLDVDTGVDDACALLFAARHPGLDLRAVTCVAGNSTLDDVVRNTLTVLDVAGAGDVPVGRGADRPLLEAHRSADHFHGRDGMGDLGWPRPSTDVVPQHAVELLRDVLLDAAARADPVTLVTLAPMTNIALLLRTHPQVAAGIERLVFMGGSAGPGNVTASAEFNVWHDPEAAAIVLAACHELDIATIMYGLEVFYEPVVTMAEMQELVAGPDGSVSRLAGELIRFQSTRVGENRATIGDAGAVCSVVDPGGITTQAMPVRVELAGAWTRGRTVADPRGDQLDLDNDPHRSAAATPVQVDVAMTVDGRRYARLWRDTVGAG